MQNCNKTRWSWLQRARTDRQTDSHRRQAAYGLAEVAVVYPLKHARRRITTRMNMLKFMITYY